MKRKRPKRPRNHPPITPVDYRRRRRERRLESNRLREEDVRTWATKHGCSLRVLNDGRHWLFEAPGLVAEWWPGSAKLALDRDYNHSRHIPHWSELRKILENRLSVSPQLPFDEIF